MKIYNYIRPLSVFALCIIVNINNLYAQDPWPEPTEPPVEITQQLENMTEADDEMETEDDAYLQSLHQFMKQPINLNDADASLLQQLNLLSPVQNI